MNRRRFVANVGAATVLAFRDSVGASAKKIGEEHVVVITGFKFIPDTLSVRVGDTITWTNRDIAPHTATSKDGTWDTDTIKKDESRSVPVTKEMTANYFCRFHIDMIGRLTLDS